MQNVLNVLDNIEGDILVGVVASLDTVLVVGTYSTEAAETCIASAVAGQGTPRCQSHIRTDGQVVVVVVVVAAVAGEMKTALEVPTVAAAAQTVGAVTTS